MKLQLTAHYVVIIGDYKVMLTDDFNAASCFASEYGGRVVPNLKVIK